MPQTCSLCSYVSTGRSRNLKSATKFLAVVVGRDLVKAYGKQNKTG